MMRRVVHRYCTEEDVKGHIADLCRTYGARRDAMLRALGERMRGGGIETLRLNFVSPSDLAIPDGIARLAEAIEDLPA